MHSALTLNLRQIDARDVYVKIDTLQKYATSISEAAAAVTTLVEYLRRSFAFVAETILTYPAGTISWHLLWSLFEAGDELETTHDVSGEPVSDARVKLSPSFADFGD